jgi:uncharacterized protein YvpB
MIVLLVVTLIVLWVILGDGDGNAGNGRVRVVAGEKVVAAANVEWLEAGPSRLTRWLARVPDGRRVRRGRATITFATDSTALRRGVRQRLREGGGQVRLPERAIAASARLPIVKQAFRNNCETAALSMLLTARGVRVSQLRLQRELPRSGPLDPRPDPRGGFPTWGDPHRGFVGRVNGGGSSGGYGVYERPIRDLARRHGVATTDLSHAPVARIYRRLLSGRPVMVWVGLSEGPVETWRTPDGRRVIGNFGEHTVVLTGMTGSDLAVNDPLTGTRTTWGRDYFHELWKRLGRRALTV